VTAQRAADLYQAATATAVEADVVRQLNLLSLTHRRAAETLRTQFGGSAATAAAAGDESDSSSPTENDVGAQSVVDLNELLASRSSAPICENGSADDFQVLGGGGGDGFNDDFDEEDEEDDDVSFVGVRAPPTFVEQAAVGDLPSEQQQQQQQHSMWGSFERLVGKVVQASAKMLAETAGLDGAVQTTPSSNDAVEAELAKLPRKTSSESLTDEFKEFVDMRESTPDPAAHRGTADASRSSSPSHLLAVASTGALSRSDTPNVGCASVDDLQLLLRQISDVLRRAPDDEATVSVNPLVLQSAASALRNAVSWRRRLTLLQTHNEQLHAAVSQLNVEVLRRAQAARSVTPSAHAMASSALGVSTAGGGGETARLQSEVALLRRQLSSVLALTSNRARQGSPAKARSRAKAAVPLTTVTPPPPAADAEAKRAAERERERTKSVTFNVPGDSRDADAAAVTNSFSERSRLTSSEPLIERESSPSKTGSDTSGVSTPPTLKQQLTANETLTASCDD
jgi:hypothetical protein